ncbi:hypothetical protein HYV82_04775 [Candidatus Woesearchaeota archaeon]|nr:hypothetical protein [Candidatus Woesearchaeota archaeon]
MEQEKILGLIKERGPIVPSQIAKDLGTNILLSSAILSELASRKLISISHVKVGGSPLYYMAGQEEKLQEYMDRLHEKEKAACEVLRDKKVLRDSALEPAARVALRQCRDFAKPLEVTMGREKEIFWKWYMLPTESVEPIIKKELGVIEQRAVEQRMQERRRVEDQRRIDEQAQKEQKEVQAAQAAQIVLQREEIEPEIETETSQVLLLRKPRITTVKPDVVLAKPKPELSAVMHESEPILSRPEVKRPEPKQETKSVASDETKKRRVPKQKAEESFAEQVNEFFSRKNITAMSEQVIRKDSEIAYLVKVQSAVGEITYFCFAKKKQSCSESDISYAYAQGQIKKLPVLFLTTGELTKRAKELLQTSEFSNVAYVKI